MNFLPEGSKLFYLLEETTFSPSSEKRSTLEGEKLLQRGEHFLEKTSFQKMYSKQEVATVVYLVKNDGKSA